MKYFTLVTRRNEHQAWGIVFGACDKDVVIAQQESIRDFALAMNLTPLQTKIISTGDQQAQIQSRVDSLNAMTVRTHKD